MPIEVTMPALSPTMTEGNLAKWLKKEGDKIEPGQVIAEIETDKATMEVEAVDEGLLGKILVEAGTQAVPVNKVIALLLEEGEDKKALDSNQQSAVSNQKKTSSPLEEEQRSVASKDAHANRGGAGPQSTAHSTSAEGRVKASPLARRIAAERGIDLAGIQGSGPHGRIIRDDVENAKGSSSSRPTAHGAHQSFGRNPQETTAIPNNQMRKVIAKRLLESKQTVPHFYLTIECEIDRLMEARQQLNDVAIKEAGKAGEPAYKLTVNDFVIKAVAMGLRKVPAANASWTDEAILQYNNVDISVAVAIDGGLITPIVKNADQKGLAQISAEVKELAARARKNALRPEEFQGGGFSVSNLGMYGIKEFSAIINPPQGCILAIGAAEKRFVPDENNQPRVANFMHATLSCDHRVVDGAVGATFLQAFKFFIENPIGMVV